MITAAWVVLVACLLLLAWTYVGYPAWLWVLARLRPRPTAAHHWQPHVTVCMAVHNGLGHLDTKLDGVLGHDYPADRLDLVVVSDGSTDGTGARLRERSGDRLTVIDAPVRRGKTACLGEAIACARGEVLVFTDVRQRLAPGSVQALCDALASGELAAVSGRLRLEDAEGYAHAVDAYWRYETAIRRAEATTGSVVGVSGALYAVRKRDMPTPPAGLVLDDVWVPMRIAADGGRIGLESAAVAFDRASASAVVESARKRRTLSGNWQLLARWPTLAVPGRHPLAWRFIHHKLLRLLAPLFLLGTLVANVALVGQGAWPVALLAAQGVAYAAAFAGLLWPALRALFPVKLASAFVEMNAYAVLGFIDFFRSRDAHLWVAAPSVLPPSSPRP